MIAYIEDILVMAESRELLVNQAARMCYLLKNLGFLINQKKSILEPSQTMEFLEFTVDIMMMEIKLLSDKSGPSPGGWKRRKWLQPDH